MSEAKMDKSRPVDAQTGFTELFEEAEAHADFWEEDAVLSFTEDLARWMEHTATSRAELARRLGTSQAYVTKILRGDANFTLKTMARLAAAVDSQLRVHLAPKDSRTVWFDQIGGERKAQPLESS